MMPAAERALFISALRTRPSIGVVALMVLLLGAALTFVAGYRVRAIETAQAEEQIDGRLQSSADELTRRLNRCTVTAQAGAVISQGNTLSADVWHYNLAALGIPSDVAVMVYAPLTGVTGTMWRAPLLHAQPTSGASTKAIGEDLMLQPQLAEAIFLAVNSGQPRLSAPLNFLGDTRSSVAMVMPVWRDNLTPQLGSERRPAAVAVVLAVIPVAPLLAPLARDLAADGQLEVFDGAAPSGQGQRLLAATARVDHDHAHYIERTYGGRIWSLRLQEPVDAAPVADRSRSRLTYVAGGLISLLLAMVTAFQGALHARAEARAKAMTNALVASEERHRDLSAMSSDWFWEQDSEFRFTAISSGVWQGRHSVESFVGLRRWDLPLDWTDAERDAHIAMLEAHQPFRDYEYRAKGEDGAVRWFSITGQPRFDKDGQFIGYLGTASDITRRKLENEELRQHRDNLAAMVHERTTDLLAAKATAEQALAAKTDFLANMSHELRTPLHAILSFSKLGQTKGVSALPAGEPAERVKNYFNKIYSAGDRLLALVNDLLDLSKLEAGKMLLNLKAHDLAQLARDVAGDVEILAEKAHQRIEILAPATPAVAMIDAPRITQVLHNLLSNAIKFSRPGGVISIVVETIGGDDDGKPGAVPPGWRLAVKDQGVGIPPDELLAVFDKFVQSSKTRTGAGGTGLGLSICKEIVEEHLGRIRAYNRPDGGAVFEVILPR